MKRVLPILVLCVLLFGACSGSLNGYDKNGQRHGRYLVTWEKGVPMQKGRFRHGYEVGKWKHYDNQGNLVKTEKYTDNQILTRHYRPGGNLESEGLAYLYFDGQFGRYSWEGIWHYYTEEGSYEYSINFVRGMPVDTLALQTKKFIYHERSAR